MDAFRMMEAPSGISGSALCTREEEALDVDAEDHVVEFLGDRAERGILRNTGIGEHDIELALLALDLRAQAIEIAEIRHVSLHAGYVSSDLRDRRRQLPVTTPAYEDVGAFVHELLRGRQADAAVAAETERASPRAIAAIRLFRIIMVSLLHS